MGSNKETDRIVMGIDFGTTFSGVASIFTGAPEAADEISVIKQWPGANGITSDKVPSELAYSPVAASSHSIGPRPSTVSRSPRWGFQINPTEVRLSYLKLLLEPGIPLPEYVSRADLEAQLKAVGKNAQDAIADYLTQIYKHAMDCLVKRYGKTFVDSTAVEIVLTVPAVWSDAAKDATLKAAQKAGMGADLRLISEPEAAAVYTLKAIQPNNLHAGDHFVVCDAGGGTVDLISYRILSADPLRLEEAVEGSAGLCGGAFLNLSFEAFVRGKLGGGRFRSLRKNKPRCWPAAIKFFEETVKRTFDPDDQGEIAIPFPGAADDVTAGISDGFLVMAAAEVTILFEKVVGKIIALIQGQVNALYEGGKSVKGIVLVGGFGQSSYLFRRVSNHFMGPPPPYTASAATASPLSTRLEVMQPNNAWTAVVRGAVLRGCEGVELVQSRKSRRNYGLRVTNKFIEGVHPARYRRWDELNEEWMVTERYCWHIEKGETVSSSEPVSMPFTRHFKETESKAYSLRLIVNNSNDAPAGADEPHGRAVRTLCKMPVDLSQVPAHYWVQRVNSAGVRFSTLNHDIGVQLGSGGLHFDLRVGGVVYGRITAAFD